MRPLPGNRVAELRWRSVAEVVDDRDLAFDHAFLVAPAVEGPRAEVERLDLPFGFLPEAFTLGELQATCEQLLGRRLDKSSLWRRLADRDVVEPVPGAIRGGAFRPAQLYRRKTGAARALRLARANRAGRLGAAVRASRTTAPRAAMGSR